MSITTASAMASTANFEDKFCTDCRQICTRDNGGLSLDPADVLSISTRSVVYAQRRAGHPARLRSTVPVTFGHHNRHVVRLLEVQFHGCEQLQVVCSRGGPRGPRPHDADLQLGSSIRSLR